MKCIVYIAPGLFFFSIRSVYGSADTSHEHHAAFQALLELRYIVFRQHALPHLYTNFGHVFNYRRKV